MSKIQFLELHRIIEVVHLRVLKSRQLKHMLTMEEELHKDWEVGKEEVEGHHIKLEFYSLTLLCL